MNHFERAILKMLLQAAPSSDIFHVIIVLAYHLHEEGIHRVTNIDYDTWKKKALNAEKLERQEMAREILFGLPVINHSNINSCLTAYVSYGHWGLHSQVIAVYGESTYRTIQSMPTIKINDICTIYS